MIVFPIINFVLPLMLTSFIFANTQGCNECKSDVELRIIESSEVENYKKTNRVNNLNELNDYNFNKEKNSRNVY